MAFKLKSTVPAKGRLPQKLYSKYALQIISDFKLTDEKLTEKQLEEQVQLCKAELSRLVSGGLTESGYKVYVKHLMGAINALSPEIANALSTAGGNSNEDERI